MLTQTQGRQAAAVQFEKWSSAVSRRRQVSEKSRTLKISRFVRRRRLRCPLAVLTPLTSQTCESAILRGISGAQRLAMGAFISGPSFEPFTRWELSQAEAVVTAFR